MKVNNKIIVKKVWNKGFTLVELLLYMGILMILIATLSSVFAETIDVQLESKSTATVDQDGRYILARLTRDMKSAQSIVSPASAGQTASSLQISVNSINYTYSLNNGDLQLTNNNGTDNLNSYNSTISNVSFQRIGNGGTKDTIKMSFQVTSKTQRNAGPASKTFNTTIGLP